MQNAQSYDIDLGVKYGFLKLIDTDAIARAATSQWSNQTLCAVNDCVVRLGIVQGEFHWHKHDREDEFFLVLSGELGIDLDDGTTVALKPGQGYAVPKGQGPSYACGGAHCDGHGRRCDGDPDGRRQSRLRARRQS